MDLCYLLTLLLSKYVQVEVSEGVLEGQIVDNEYGCPFFSFRGIPYAEPPVGDLRFKAPVPKQPWEGIRDATQFGSPCFTQSSNPATSSEDCLFLNVYTPNIAPEKPLPVMVHVHGGGFVTGSSNGRGPKFLVRKDVILVTLNYRLEILGFLSLDNEDVPGNAGMKDQVAAMRWVKKNIRKFGGDPDNITLFGESAAGACVSFHLVSPMSKGLFNRAITQSGTLTSWFPYTFRARDRALILARQLGCTSTDDKEIYECLKAQPRENLVNQKIAVSFWQSAKEAQNVFYAVVSERQFGDNERFFYGEPFEMLRKGVHEGIQVMSGYSQDDGVLYFAPPVQSQTVFSQANQFLEFFVPEPYTVHTPLKTQMDIGHRFRDYYMNKTQASLQNIDNVLKFVSMELFIYGAISQQRVIAKTSNNTAYLYKFTCVSELNMFIYYMGISHLFTHRPIVGHADELGYLFSMFPVQMNSPTFRLIDQITTLWTNFAKYSDPTPDDSLGVKWKPYTMEGEDYLNLGNVLTAEKQPEKEEVDFWESNFKEFLPNYAP